MKKAASWSMPDHGLSVSTKVLRLGIAPGETSAWSTWSTPGFASALMDGEGETSLVSRL